jgi:hypothetical protein
MSGIFGLGEVRTEQLNNTWSESANYGYFAGGSFPNPGAPNDVFCTIDRIDFSTETVSLPGSSLSQKRYDLAAVSSSNYSYLGGGYDGSYPVCTIDRIDFSTETVAEPSTYQLTEKRSSLAAVSNFNYGYFGGGSSFPRVCIIDRIDFSSETVSLPGPSLTTAKSSLAAVSSSNYGYFGGGYDITRVSTIDRIDFSTETVVGPPSHGANLPSIKNNQAAVSSSNYGYFAGGAGPGVVFCTIDRIDFSSETVSNFVSLTGKRADHAGVSNSNYGYLAGGYTPPNDIICTIDRIDFSTETVVAPGTYQLTQARYHLAGVSGGKSVNSRGIRKGSDKDGKGISSTYGYFAGGINATTGSLCTIDRIDFSSETVVTPGTYQLTKARHNNASSGLSNPNYGYFGGGNSPIPTPNSLSCTIDRIDFSNETVAVPPVGKELTQARSDLAAVSNSNYGYFGGGYTPTNRVCTIDRLDFSNETILIPASTPQLTKARSGLAAVSNSNYGYFGGGVVLPPVPTQVCTIDRIDFSTETVEVPSVAKQLSQSRNGHAAVSNSNYGYFAGGFFYPPSTYLATIDRFDFSNETILIPASTPQLSEGRSGLAALSNSNYGYFAGGSDGGYVETIDRIDFSTESVTDAAPTELSATRIGATGVSN